MLRKIVKANREGHERRRISCYPGICSYKPREEYETAISIACNPAENRSISRGEQRQAANLLLRGSFRARK
jgi:hypothetical protein